MQNFKLNLKGALKWRAFVPFSHPGRIYFIHRYKYGHPNFPKGPPSKGLPLSQAVALTYCSRNLILS